MLIRECKFRIIQGLFFPSQNDLFLCPLCDSDWKGCPVSQKSTTGYCVFCWILPHLLANREADDNFSNLSRS